MACQSSKPKRRPAKKLKGQKGGKDHNPQIPTTNNKTCTSKKGGRGKKKRTTRRHRNLKKYPGETRLKISQQNPPDPSKAEVIKEDGDGPL